MSNTLTTPAQFTVTADIEVTRTGTAFLRVAVDGEQVTFRLDPNSMRLRRVDVTVEATRLLQKHAGYAPASDWMVDDHGHLTATVAEITGRCTTCVHGCGHTIGDTGCGHYGCPAAPAGHANTCDGAALPLTAKRTYPYANGRTARR